MTRNRDEKSTSQYDMVMSLPETIFDVPSIEATIPKSSSNDTLGMTEDIPVDIAISLIGENQHKPGCTYKLITTMDHTCVTQYDSSKDRDDPDYCTEYELEEYHGSYRPGIDEGSVSSGFWQGTDMPPTGLSPMAIVIFILVLLFFVGIGFLGFLLYLGGGAFGV